MGTRATVTIKQNDSVVSNLLVSADGYLSGLGSTILEVMTRKHVNGYTDDQKQYNRVGNFVALIIAKLVIQQTESSKRMAEFFKKEQPGDLSCGGVEVVHNIEKQNVDFHYEINFSCSLDNPMPPKIKVKSYDFESEWLTAQGFSELIEKGIQDDEDN